jgi:DNA-binding response OmpR family regulator
MAKTILVVDDDEPTREVIALLLVDAGYQVIEAGNIWKRSSSSMSPWARSASSAGRCRG